MRSFFMVLICFSLLMITGCATVMTGNKQKISLMSDPIQAKVSVYNPNSNKLIQTVQTPATVSLSKSTRSYRFLVEKEGYQQTVQLINKKAWPPNSWYWGNILLFIAGPITALVDVIDGAAYDFPDSAFFRLERNPEPYRPPVSQRQSTNSNVEVALAKASQVIIEKIPQRSRIAIVYITSPEKSLTDYILGELEVIWIKDGYTIIDRSQLERVRQEQRYQLSGEVDDTTAVSIGKIAGADIIIIGGVDGEGNYQRLRLRALDAQTARVLVVASEKI